MSCICKQLLFLTIITLGTLCAGAIQPFAVVTVPVANLRVEPRHGAELASQGILGTPMIIENKIGEWYSVQLPDGYRGYMIDNSLQTMDSTSFRQWQESDRGVINTAECYMAAGPGRDYDCISPLQLCDVLSLTGKTITDNDSIVWTEVTLPDNRRGYVPVDFLYQFDKFGRNGTEYTIEDKIQDIINIGTSRIGQEYLWGGTSIKAADCSGFTCILYQYVGTYLPRDAWQQALAGIPIEESDLKAGDLVFFNSSKGKVNHVGIYIGYGLMLHCSGRVRIDALWYDPEITIRNGGIKPDIELYDRKPAAYRRILTGTPLESDITANKFYFNK